MIELFDTHTHLNTARFDGEIEEIIQRAWEQYGVKYMNLVGYDEQTNYRAVELATKYPHLFATVGWHPVDAIDFNDKIHTPQLDEYLKQDKVVSVGEIGLDYHWDKSPKDIQHDVFNHQIAIAIKHRKPVVIHMREATEDVIKVLDKWHKSHQITGIMHSFSGSVETAKHLTNISFMLSLSGIVTFKNAGKILDVAKEVNQQFLLVETDAPFLTPVPFRGKRNEPGYTRYVAEQLASLRGETIEDVAAYTTSNAKRIFKID